MAPERAGHLSSRVGSSCCREWTDIDWLHSSPRIRCAPHAQRVVPTTWLGASRTPSHRHTHLRGFATHPRSFHTHSVTSHTHHSSHHALRASQSMRRARRLSPRHPCNVREAGALATIKSPKSGMPCSMCANPPHSRTRRGRAGFSKCGRSPTTARAGVGTVLVRLCARSAIGDRVVIVYTWHRSGGRLHELVDRVVLP